MQHPLSIFSYTFANEQHLNLVQLVYLALQVSNFHDQAVQKLLTQPLLTENQTWVVTQYHIDVLQKAPTHGDVTIQTQVTEANRFFVTRQFVLHINHQHTHTIIAQFVALDFSTRKMVRFPIDELQSLHLITGTATKFKAIHTIETPTETYVTAQHIQATDIDSNHHVNNLVYLNWCVQCLPPKWLETYDMTQLQIKYGSELTEDHTVAIHTFLQQEEKNGETYQVIRNESLEKDACYVNMTWKIKE